MLSVPVRDWIWVNQRVLLPAPKSMVELLARASAPRPAAVVEASELPSVWKVALARVSGASFLRTLERPRRRVLLVTLMAVEPLMLAPTMRVPVPSGPLASKPLVTVLEEALPCVAAPTRRFGGWLVAGERIHGVTARPTRLLAKIGDASGARRSSKARASLAAHPCWSR
jgi:hypothetical protein